MVKVSKVTNYSEVLKGQTSIQVSTPLHEAEDGDPDLLLEAKSGTGKTAVFTVITLDMLNDQPDAQIMILAPTREIAAQIANVIKQIGSTFEGLQVEVVMGGLPLSEDVNKFAHKRKVQVIVGSPGRLRHLIEKRHIDTTSVRLFILDEADKLMEGSFKADINYIFSSLPNCKQVIMSSATYPEPLKELIFKYMKKYVHICPNSTSILLGIEQRMTVVKQHDNNIVQTQLRYAELVKIFKSRQFKQCLIFCNYQARVVEIWKKLHADKWPAQYLHGKQDQMDRLVALKTLQDYKCRILVSTDLAARGIDASNVDLVVNFEIPYEWTTYLHRIGRAGRYGSYGMAISLVAQGNEEDNFNKLICSLGGPVNIKPLWTDEAIDLNGDTVFVSKENSDDKTREETVFSKSGPYLWNLTNNEDDQNDDRQVEIEDFDNLNESYDRADSFQNFGDLLDSYEMNNVKKTKTAYSVIDVNGSKVTGDVFLSLGHPDFKIQTKKINNDKLAHLNDVTSVYGEKITIKHEMSLNTNNKRDYTENYSMPVKKNDNLNNNYSLNNPNLIIQNHNSRIALNRSESTHLHKEPRQSKLSNCFDTASLSLSNSLDLNDNINLYPDIDWVPVAESACITAQDTDRKVSLDQVDSSSESESEYTKTSSSTTCGSEDRSEDEHLHWEEGDKSNQTYMSRNVVHKAYQQAAAKNYIIWKRQLAARRAHIQMAVYTEEMGKLATGQSQF